MKFKEVAIYYNSGKPQNKVNADSAVAYLKGRGINASIVDLYSGEKIPPKTDLLVSIGGDGAMLYCVRAAAPERVPVVGVNAGNLGFLTADTMENFEEIFKDIFEDKFIVSKRSLLSVALKRDGKKIFSKELCFNDCVLRSEGLRAFSVKISFLGIEWGKILGDGVIIATPTGSTAYSLAAGGPVVSPELRAMIITPICPHTLRQRPLVIPEGLITLVPSFNNNNDLALLNLDGHKSVQLKMGDVVEIKPAPAPAKLIFREGHNFFSNLTQKFKWGNL